MRIANYLPLYIASITALLGNFACSEADSCAIVSSEINVDWSVVEEDGEITAYASFWVGSNRGLGTILELGEGGCSDSISVNGQKIKSKLLDIYSAKIAKTDEYEFVFERDEESFSGTVTIPETVAITAPASKSEHSRAEDLEVTWQGRQNEEIKVEIDGICIAHEWEKTADDGAFVFAADSIEQSSEEDDSDADPSETTCDAEIRLERVSAGTIDSGLHKNSDLKGRTVSKVTVQTIP